MNQGIQGHKLSIIRTICLFADSFCTWSPRHPLIELISAVPGFQSLVLWITLLLLLLFPHSLGEIIIHMQMYNCKYDPVGLPELSTVQLFLLCHLVSKIQLSIIFPCFPNMPSSVTWSRLFYIYLSSWISVADSVPPRDYGKYKGSWEIVTVGLEG